MTQWRGSESLWPRGFLTGHDENSFWWCGHPRTWKQKKGQCFPIPYNATSFSTSTQPTPRPLPYGWYGGRRLQRRGRCRREKSLEGWRQPLCLGCAVRLAPETCFFCPLGPFCSNRCQLAEYMDAVLGNLQVPAAIPPQADRASCPKSLLLFSFLFSFISARDAEDYSAGKKKKKKTHSNIHLRAVCHLDSSSKQDACI